MARQNMALFQRAANMLNPLSNVDAAGQATDDASAASREARDTSIQIKELNERIEALQRQLGELIEVQQAKR
jgi:polyhydroxyalkanoate synthesis regulator protein